VESISSSKLFTTRQGTVLLGVIAAVIAAIALIVYLNHYRNSVAQSDVQVLVANKTIPQGMTGDQLAQATGFYVLRNIPKDQVLSGAITDTSTLAGKVATSDIKPNSQLTESQFSAPTGLAVQLKPGDRAVVVALGSPQSVGGQIVPGSRVDVWVTSSGQGSNGVSRPVAKLLFQDMEVMNAVDGGNVTLMATWRQAGQLIYASSNAQIWLTLRPTLGTTTKRPPVISSAAVVGG
jgi:Flp pilus assembly protein CpaB